jgi:hypothetical protein
MDLLDTMEEDDRVQTVRDVLVFSLYHLVERPNDYVRQAEKVRGRALCLARLSTRNVNQLAIILCFLKVSCVIS